MSTIRTAVVGCGGAGLSHVRGHEQTEGVKLVAVCDAMPDRAEKAAAQAGVKAYTSLEAMLESERLDAVSVATPERFHHEPAMAALRAGAHVLSEKVMAHTLEAGRAMVAAAGTAGKRLGVSYNYRHIPSFAFLHGKTSDGAIGELTLFTAQTHAFCWHHTLDLMCLFMGYPAEVQAELNDDPLKRPALWPEYTNLLYVPGGVVSATFRFETGALAAVASTIDVSVGEHLIDIALCGTKGRFAIHDVHVANTNGAVSAGGLNAEVAGLPQRTLEESISYSARLFLEALRDGKAPPTDGGHGLRIMEIEHATLVSARERRAVRIGS